MSEWQDVIDWTVDESFIGQRVDAAVAAYLNVSRSQVQQWCDDQLVRVNENNVNKKYKLRQEDRLTVCIPAPEQCEALPENIPLDIVYEDEHLLVVNKPKGMVVHPAAGHYSGTLVNALLHHCGDSLSGINGVLRPGIVHRIDMDTSGLLIVAKSDKAHQGLAEQIQVHSFTRIYEAVIVGHLKQSSGTVDAPIGRHPTQRKKMAVIATNSKQAITHYEVLQEYRGYSHIRLRLETGRTHQIRVHMAYLGHPIAGDTVYGATNQPRECVGLNGQCLHARCIGFVHPITGDELYFDSELPSYFTDFLNCIDE